MYGSKQFQCIHFRNTKYQEVCYRSLQDFSPQMTAFMFLLLCVHSIHFECKVLCILHLHFINFKTISCSSTHGGGSECVFLTASFNISFKVTSHLCYASLQHPSVALSTDGERWQFGILSHIHLMIQTEKEEYLLVISYHSGRKESMERHQWEGVLPKKSTHTLNRCVKPEHSFSSIGSIHRLKGSSTPSIL